MITWDYSSPQDIHYKHSEVSLYKIERTPAGDVLEPVFINQIQEERELKVDGNAGDEYCIKVCVVDFLDKKSKVVSADFRYTNVQPEIVLTLDTSKENEGLLGIKVKNNTPKK